MHKVTRYHYQIVFLREEAKRKNIKTLQDAWKKYQEEKEPEFRAIFWDIYLAMRDEHL